MKKIFDGGALIGIGMLIIFVGMTVLGIGVSKVNKKAEKYHNDDKIKVLIVKPPKADKDLPPPAEPDPAPPPQDDKTGPTWWWPFSFVKK